MSARKEIQPAYSAFSWLPSRIEGDKSAQFAANVMAVTYGCSTIANIVRRNSMATENGVAPFMSGPDLDTLVGLLVFSVDTLRDAAEDQIDHLDAKALKGSAQ